MVQPIEEFPLPENLAHKRPHQVMVWFDPERGANLDHYLIESDSPITREDLEDVGKDDQDGITYLGRTPALPAEGEADSNPVRHIAAPEGPYWAIVTQRVAVKTPGQLLKELRSELGDANGAVKGILAELAERLVGGDA